MLVKTNISICIASFQGSTISTVLMASEIPSSGLKLEDDFLNISVQSAWSVLSIVQALH